MSQRKLLKTFDESEKKEKLLADEEESEKLDDVPPLVRHVAYFGGDEHAISAGSIYNKNLELGDHNRDAATNATIVSFAAGLKLSKCPFATFKPSQGIELIHAYHTGIYQNDGKINEEVWKELCNYAIDTQFENESKDIITKTQFYKFLEARRKSETSWNLGAKAASNGEWSKFWEKFGSPIGHGEQYITVKDMRTFFEDSSKLGKKVEEKVKEEKRHTPFSTSFRM